MIIGEIEKNVKRERIDKYAAHKQLCAKVAGKMLAAGYDERARKIYNCSDIIRSKICPNCGRMEVIGSMRCKDRFCPICGWLLSERRYIDMVNTMSEITKESPIGIEYTFLTLTVRNCQLGDLNSTITKIMQGINRMMQRRTIKKHVKGWARSLEITYNYQAKTWHPHVHMIILSGVETTITPKEWQTAWKSACRLDYDPIIDARAIYNRALDIQTVKDGQAYDAKIKAALETYKYTIKASDVIDAPIFALGELVEALKGRRVVAFGGIVKDARSKLGIADEEEDETPVESKCECAVPMVDAVARWSLLGNTYDIVVLGGMKSDN